MVFPLSALSSSRALLSRYFPCLFAMSLLHFSFPLWLNHTPNSIFFLACRFCFYLPFSALRLRLQCAVFRLFFYFVHLAFAYVYCQQCVVCITESVDECESLKRTPILQKAAHAVAAPLPLRCCCFCCFEFFISSCAHAWYMCEQHRVSSFR